MSLYDAAKDAVKLAQKADNIELIQKLLDVQQQALEMQDKQLRQNQKVADLEKEVELLKELGKYEFAPSKKWLIDPQYPERKLCPVCTRKLNLPVPLTNTHCFQCKGYY